MRFLIRLKAVKLPRSRLLETVRTVGRTFGVDPRNPKWTSYGALELDIFAPTDADYGLFVAAVSPLADFEFSKDLGEVPHHAPEPELFAEARQLFNHERYWECHEILEGMWRIKQGGEKRLLQGMILVCAGFVHHQKGEDEVGLGVLRRSEPLMELADGNYGGLDIARLKHNVRKTLLTGRFVNFRV